MGALEIRTIDLEPREYRDKGAVRRPRFTFLEALSFSIASTWATRKRVPHDKDKADRQATAIAYGLCYYFTHKYR